jgi:hypothetical protein
VLAATASPCADDLARAPAARPAVAAERAAVRRALGNRAWPADLEVEFKGIKAREDRAMVFDQREHISLHVLSEFSRRRKACSLVEKPAIAVVALDLDGQVFQAFSREFRQSNYDFHVRLDPARVASSTTTPMPSSWQALVDERRAARAEG